MTCSRDEAGALVQDLLPQRWCRRDPPLSSVGRLDKDTSGLLLMTDDGPLLHRIIAPRTHVANATAPSSPGPCGATRAASSPKVV